MEKEDYKGKIKRMNLTQLAEEWTTVTSRLLGKTVKPKGEKQRMKMRLTEVKKNGEWQLKGVPWTDLRAGAALSEKTSQKLYAALFKLKDYENTELSPGEIERMTEDDA